MSAKPLTTSPLFTLTKRALDAPSPTSACMVAADLIALTLVYWMTVLARYGSGGRSQLAYYVQLYPAVSLFIAGFLIQDLYPGILLQPAEEIRRVFRCITSVFLLVACTTVLWHNSESYSRFVFLAAWAAGAPFVLLTRQLVRMWLSSKSWWGVPAVVLGSPAAARRVIDMVRSNRVGLRVSGVLTSIEPDSWNRDLPPVLGSLDDAPQVARSGAAKYAIVTMPHSSNHELHQTIQNHCIGFRHVLLVPDLPGLSSLHISAREIGGQVALEMPQRLFHLSASITKRFLDVMGSSLVLIALSPLFAVISLLIKLTSTGPAFFGHARFGRDGHRFKAWKFRTMVPNADEALRHHLDTNPAAREEWARNQKLREDPRVTFVGKWLRRSSLDELPQLWNVLVGDMSLVGPRPIVKAEVEKYGTAYGLYKRVIPGITGLWQVSGRNNTTYKERIAFDEYYVRNWSVWLDSYILARTIRTVLTGAGAY